MRFTHLREILVFLYACMYLGWEEVVVDVVGEAGHLLEPGAGAVLEHLVEDVVAPLVVLLVGDAGLLEQVEVDEAAGQLTHVVEVDADELALGRRIIEQEKILQGTFDFD